MLQERHELREEIDMRKIALEQLMTSHKFQPHDIQRVLSTTKIENGGDKRHSAPANLCEQWCFDYVLKLSQTQSSNVCNGVGDCNQDFNTASCSSNSLDFTTSMSEFCDNERSKNIKNNKRLSLCELPFTIKDNSFLHHHLT